MGEQQLRLFDPPKPLLSRLGAEFFRTLPAAPGVYRMFDAQQRLLYVGQSQNLRKRLASYKNAHPDRGPRKVIRLIHAVERIEWELCETAAQAKVRENHYLRTHRPRFNKVNTFPQAYLYFWFTRDSAELILGVGRECPAQARCFGAFKPGCLAAFGALVRLLWHALTPPVHWDQGPSSLRGLRAPRRMRFPVALDGEFLPHLEDYLEGSSPELTDWVRGRLPPPQSLPLFERRRLTCDCDRLQRFFISGPGRNRALRRRFALPHPLIDPEQLDDLLAWGEAAPTVQFVEAMSSAPLSPPRTAADRDLPAPWL